MKESEGRKFYIVITNENLPAAPLTKTGTIFDGQKIEHILPITDAQTQNSFLETLQIPDEPQSTLESTPRAHLDKIYENPLLHDTTPFHSAVASLVPLLRENEGRIALSKAAETSGLPVQELLATLSIDHVSYFFTDGDQLVSRHYFPEKTE